MAFEASWHDQRQGTVIKPLQVRDRYTEPVQIVRREIDIALVDANGDLDIVEIKKPLDDVLSRKTLYRQQCA